MPDRYFRLNDDIGVEPPYVTDPETGQPADNPKTGELQPLAAAPEFTVRVPSKDPTNGGIVMKEKRIKPTLSSADPRTIHTSDVQLIDGITQTECFHEVDPPKTTTKEA